MIRNLTIVAVASFVLAMGCFAGAAAQGGGAGEAAHREDEAGAAALGGRDILKTWNFPADWHVDIDDGDDHVRIRPGDDLSDADRETIVRDVAWTGGDALQVDLPAEVIYTQAAPGAAATVRISGPRRQVDRVTIDGGRIRLKDDGRGFHISRRHDQLTVEVSAPAVRRFTLNGSGDLSLRSYDQPSLALEINGSGDADAQGKAQKVDLRIAGSGEADLSALDGGDVDVALAGSGSARVAPRGAAKIEVAGSGEVDVTTKPASLVTDVAGSGDVNQDW